MPVRGVGWPGWTWAGAWAEGWGSAAAEVAGMRDEPVMRRTAKPAVNANFWVRDMRASGSWGGRRNGDGVEGQIGSEGVRLDRAGWDERGRVGTRDNSWQVSAGLGWRRGRWAGLVRGGSVFLGPDQAPDHAHMFRREFAGRWGCKQGRSWPMAGRSGVGAYRCEH